MRALLVVFGCLAAAAAARAHGINGHVHVTGWAIERLPPGPLRDFFADPEVRDAALIGAAFPDSGYAIGDDYGELAHWEPFVDAHVRFVRERFGPPFETLEARKHAAFLMGGACHGLQDELFDSVFLHQIREHDGRGQDEADPGTDAFLFTDGHLEYQPPLYVPADDLVEVFARAHGHAVTPRTIRDGMQRVKIAVIDHFDAIAPRFDARYRPLLPWTAAHYLDPEVPGSLAAEVPATAAYLQALWERLHDRWPASALVVHTWPDPPRRLRSTDPARVDSWVTVIFGTGAIVGSLTPETVELLDDRGAPVPFALHHTRWSGRPEDTTRLVQLRPGAALATDAAYTVRLLPGVRLVDGRTLEAPWSFVLRTPCAPEDAERCAPPDAGPPDAAPGPLPDLVVDGDRILASARIDEREFRPESCALFEGCILEPGRRKLVRFDVETANIGAADLVMGSPNDNPDLFEWSPCHGHFHFNDYARYALLDAEGNVVAPGHKQSFCLLDSRRVLDEPGVSDRGQFHCGRQGISRGWSDVYGAGLDCQWIDITDVPPGRYRIRVEVNFNGVLPESDYENNAVEVEFTIPNDDITVPCAAGEPPGPDRDCGWTLAETVACEPGDRVAVGCAGAGACDLGACQGDPVLRVCPGDGRPCFAGEALATGDDACDTACPQVEVVCPLDGAVTVFTGPGEDAPFVCEVGARVLPPPPPTDPCPDFGTGPRRECGWQVAADAGGPLRGRACDPGATLLVGCNPAPAQCGEGIGVTCTGDPMLRICAGDADCRYDAAVATNDDACGGNLCPETSFVCPEAGAFTVLTAPYSNGVDFTCDVAVVPAP